MAETNKILDKELKEQEDAIKKIRALYDAAGNCYRENKKNFQKC